MRFPWFQIATMKITSKNKTGNGNKNAQVVLAEINAQIEALNQKRVTLAQPLKDRYTEMRGEMTALETEIRSLDAAWKPEPMKPKAEARIAEVIRAQGGPMSAEEITKELAGVFTNWKIKNVLKRKSTGAKAVFTLNDGRYSLKAVA
jgi:hypothetical protein